MRTGPYGIISQIEYYDEVQNYVQVCRNLWQVSKAHSINFHVKHEYEQKK